MFSLIHLQIIIESVFFVAVFFLLWRLKLNIEKYRPLADGTVIADLKQIMTDSQASADGFIEMLEENKLTLKKLARQLEEKERMLVMLIDQAEATGKKLDNERVKLEAILSHNPPSPPFDKGGDRVVPSFDKGGDREAFFDKGGTGMPPGGMGGALNKRYEDVIEMARQGMSREALASQSDLSEDEINLIMAFARAKKD